MKKVTITLSEDIWKWWKDNPWINLSQLTERELKRIKGRFGYAKGFRGYGI